MDWGAESDVMQTGEKSFALSGCCCCIINTIILSTRCKKQPAFKTGKIDVAFMIMRHTPIRASSYLLFIKKCVHPSPMCHNSEMCVYIFKCEACAVTVLRLA
jgi:hypothetical protein